MAFPTIPTVAAGRVLSSLNTNPAGTHTFPNLSSLTKNSGDLLIAIVIIYDGNSTNAEFSSWGGGFTEFVDQAGTATMGIGCAYKWSTGSETGTFTVVSADTSANDSACFLISIPGAHATTPPEGGAIANGTSAAADPASLNPAGWGTEDTLWIAVGGCGETSTTGSFTGVAAAPTNYTDYVDSGISADVVGGVEGALAFRQLNAASEDVGGFSVDVSNARNSALLLAVRPAPAPQIINVGLASETDEAFATGRIKTRAVGLLAETDEALAMTVDQGGGQDIPVGLASETDSAFAISRSKLLVIGQPNETDTAFAMSRRKALALGLATEIDIAFSVAEYVAVVTVWVSYGRVWRFKEVRRVYLTTTAFKNAVETELRGSAVWARWKPGVNPWSGSSNMQINTTDIPNVPPLSESGHLYLP